MNRTEIDIYALSPDRLGDFLHFFDHVAFADHPEWSHCYCYMHHFPHDLAESWKQTTAVGNRKAVSELIAKGKMHGYLAYRGGQVVGWCNAGPRQEMTTKPEDGDPLEPQIGSIMCFLIAREQRRQGIAKALLVRACDDFHLQGFKYAEAYPIMGVEGEFNNHCGPLALFKTMGFEIVGQDEDQHIMRRPLPLSTTVDQLNVTEAE